MTKGRYRKSIAARKEGPYSHQYSKSRRRPATAHLCLDITIRMFASRYRSCIKGIRTDLHNLNLWQASSKVVLDVPQLPKTAKEEQVDSNLQLDRTHLHEIWTLCSQFSLQGNEQPQMDRSNRLADTSSFLVERKPKSYVRKTEQF